MLFNSYQFLLIFLPVTLFCFWSVSRFLGHSAGIYFLIIASTVFYAAWNPPDVWVIVVSVCANYAAGRAISTPQPQGRKKLILGVAVAANLTYLAYFKYAVFLTDNFNKMFGGDYVFGHVVLPLGISFFTFQQITYLVDIYRGQTHRWSFRDYVNCVTFFPHLIAGPIVHYREILPQFNSPRAFRPAWSNIAVGVSLLSMGLIKKVLIADSISPYADAVFVQAAHGPVSLLDAWFGVLAFTFQIYFDFSGYSDMAIGLARMMGIKLPMNFNSPYKSTNIIEFWRRWHITLSRLLRDYLYIPLGGNRKGRVRRHVNLMLTMLIGGLWHGAAWTFVLWGGLHGLYLIANHFWNSFQKWFWPSRARKPHSFLSKFVFRAVTFFCVMWAWVPFRAHGFGDTLNIWQGLVGLNGFVLPQVQFDRFGRFLDVFGATPGFTVEPWGPSHVLVAGVLLAIVWFMPNSADIMNRARPVLRTEGRDPLRLASWMSWKPNWVWSLALWAGMIVALGLMVRPSQFVYFQF